jgi:hypothetical protein
MSQSTASRPSGSPQPMKPMAPPAEVFWQKYSPHYEFPLSSIGSVALHVLGVVLFLGLLWLMNSLRIDSSTPVPIRQMTVATDDGSENGAPGAGGGSPEENIDPVARPMDPNRTVPETALNEVLPEVKDWVPKVPQGDDAPRVEDLPQIKPLANLNDDLRKKLLQGKGDPKGAGNQEGKGPADQEGNKTGGTGDAASSKSRAIRWQLVFKTDNGTDYTKQLAAMKATIAFPIPPANNELLIFRDLSNPKGEKGDIKSLPELYFIDDLFESAARVGKVLGTDFAPRSFIAFFPKEIEEELAQKERNYRNRKEDQIFSTTFRILVRDGKFTITVTDQIPVRR